MKLKKAFTLILLSAPFLSLYSTTVATFSFFDVTLIFLAIILIVRKQSFGFSKEFLIYGLMIIAEFMIVYSLIDDNEVLDVVLRMLRYIFYVFFLTLFVKDYFMSELGEKIYGKISVISSVFLAVQLIVYKITQYYIPGFISFLPLVREEMYWHATNYQKRFFYDPRPRSFFSEPQIFASFVLGYLAILFGKEVWTKKDKIIVIVLSLGVLISISTTAIICLAFLWMMFGLRVLKKKRANKFLWTIMFCSIILISFCAIFFYSQRLSFGSFSMMGRLRGYTKILSDSQEPMIILFGHGMINIDSTEFVAENGFVPSLLRLFYYFGSVGLIVSLMLFAMLYKRTQRKYKLLMLLNILLMVGTVDFFGIMLFVNMPFVLANQKRGEIL